MTNNYTGAEIESFIRSSTSFAITENKVLRRDISELQIHMRHFDRAKEEFHPQFGQDEKEISNLIPT